MLKFFKEAIKGSEGLPPKVVSDALNKKFGEVINVDWLPKDTHYEAIFYKDKIEHIAIFTYEGVLEKYKVCLTKDFLPVSIKAEMDMKGEIMNVVLINDGKSILYEIILRNQLLVRTLMLITHMGVVIEERVL